MGSPSTTLAALQARLEDHQKAEALADIVDHLDVVRFALHSLESLLARGEVIAENLADGAKELRGLSDPGLVRAMGDLSRSAPDLAHAVDCLRPTLRSEAFEKLADPSVAASLAQLAEHTELLVFAAQAAEGFLARAESIAEAAADGVRDFRSAAEGGTTSLRESITQLARVLPGLQALMNATAPLVESGAIQALADSKVLAPEVVATMGDLGDSLHAARTAEIQPMGLFGLLRVMKDPDVQRALGFTTAFLREFGRRLK